MIRKRAVILAAATTLTALVSGSAAGGYALGRAVDVRPGGSATFLATHWRCNNSPTLVACFNGDASPWVQLTSTRRGGITVRVHTLKDPQGGRLTRTYERGQPVYVFTAF